MNFKRKIQTLAAGAVLTSALFHGVAMASDSVTVSKGDTLWKLSQHHGTSVATIKKVNNLNSNTIHVGQQLKMTVAVAKNVTAQANKQPNNIASQKETPVTMYTVKKGDTLDKIGKQFGIRYQDIQAWNKLPSSTIRVGQKLKLSGTTKTTSITPTPAKKEATPVMTSKRQELINVAKKLIGVPYKWAGTTPTGFDCSGFMYYTMKSQDLVSSRLSVSGFWSQAKKIKNPVPGDLVFFQNTYKSGPSHIGILLGNGQFIHAGSDGVAIDSINSTYWKKHFLGYGTFL